MPEGRRPAGAAFRAVRDAAEAVAGVACFLRQRVKLLVRRRPAAARSPLADG